MKLDLNELQQRLGMTFANGQLLRQAFTHSSYVNEHRGGKHKDNERLEFLGDAVLELAVSEFLFNTYTQRSEGELTRLRATIVCESSLVRFAEDLQFGKYVRLGKGEEMTGGRTRPALLADVFEAFIGALYLDQGFEAVQHFMQHYVFPKLATEGRLQFQDFKTQLQEFVQQRGMGQLQYKIVAEKGPAHDREFVAEVYLDTECLGVGTGKSKKESEQQAAQKALVQLRS